MAQGSSTQSDKIERLRNTAFDFCTGFASGVSGHECLDRFFTTNPVLLEHGPPWATTRLPFLAVPFQGRRGQDGAKTGTCDDYYDLLTATLAVEPGSVVVPPKQYIAVDADQGIVTVRLHAKFSSIKTGKAWEEDFVYVLSKFDEDAKIGCQELWADPLSAYSAVGG